MQKKTLIIQVSYPGLGDHLLYSHIPRIAIETEAYEQVFISSQSCYRNPEVRKLVWELNPFVTGFTEASGRAHIVTHATQRENILDKIMLGFQLEDGKRGHEPEIYYQPEFKLEYNLNIYDPNYISVGGKNITREVVEKYFRENNIIIDASMSIRDDNAIALLPYLHEHRYLDAPLFTFCDIIFSCKSLYCLVTGTATLAAALNRSATVFYSTGVKDRFLHSQQHMYVFFPPAAANSAQMSNETSLAKNITTTNFVLLKNKIYQRISKAWRTIKRSPKLVGKRLLNKAFPIVELDQNLQPRLDWLEKTLSAIPRGQRILDAGAGERALAPFCTHLIYVAQDFAEYDGRGDGKGLQTGTWDQTKLDIISDICAIPEPDASFDAVLCTEVFEHLPDPIAAVKEISRLLKPGGELILTAPFCACTHFAPYFYGTGFSQYWYEKHFTEVGLVIEEITPNGNFSSYLLQEVGRIPFMAKNYTKTKLSLFDRIGLRLVKTLLSKMLRSDSDSHEFLNFGYHVRAIKKGTTSSPTPEAAWTTKGTAADPNRDHK